MSKFTALTCLCLIGLSALGCSNKETTSSANIKTGGIAALIDVYADTDTTATVHVELKIAGSSSTAFVDLDNGDKLIATVDDVEKQLTARDAGVYEAKFTDVAEGAAISVTLERPDDVTASDNSGTLPPPFTLDKPTSKLSRETDDLELTWAPGSDDKMTLRLDGSCIYPFNKDSVPDTGSYTVGAGKLSSTDEDMPEACDVEVDARRTREGTADGEFDPESYFRMHQRRSTKFVSNP